MSALPPIAGDGRGRRIAAVAGLAVGDAASAGIAAFATRDVFAAIGRSSPDLPIAAVALVASAALALALMRVGERVVAERLGQDYAAALRLALFTHVTKMSVGDVARRRLGSLTIRFVGDLRAVRGWVSLGLTRLLSAGIVLPAATAILFLLDPSLALAAAVPLGAGLVAMATAGWLLGPAHRRLRSRSARLAADISERLPCGPELRLLGRTRLEAARLGRVTERLIRAALRRAWGAAILRAIPDLVADFGAAGLMLAALRTGTPAAEVAGGLAALGLMIRPLRDLAGVADRYRAWAVARDKCARLLAASTLGAPLPRHAGRVPAAPPTVRFVAVSGGMLDGISVQATAGERIAVIGPNGAGKSTLLNLAAGLERPLKGEVLVAGRSPIGLAAARRGRIITLVNGRSPVLAGSLRRALSLGAAKRPAAALLDGNGPAACFFRRRQVA